jgi:hypothetical protein
MLAGMQAWLAAAVEGQVLHLRAGWILILLGFVSGAVLGLGFHREGFLGGYASLRRRLLRLGHIALIALGALNVLYALMPFEGAEGTARELASCALLIGAIAMPATCALSALWPRLCPLFALPVAALLTAGAGIVLELF